MTAGTSASRTTNASAAMATPRASPNSLMERLLPSRKEKKTVAMMAAAATTTRPMDDMPCVIAARGV